MKSVVAIANKYDDDVRDSVAGSIFYEYELLSFIAATLSAVKNPSVDCLRQLIAANHAWLCAFEAHCALNSQGGVKVGKLRRRGRDEELGRTKVEFGLVSLLTVHPIMPLTHA